MKGSRLCSHTLRCQIQLTGSPSFPASPFSPWRPGGPRTPLSPCLPGRPASPRAPFGPSLPAGPAGPAEPGLPCRGKRDNVRGSVCKSFWMHWVNRFSFQGRFYWWYTHIRTRRSNSASGARETSSTLLKRRGDVIITNLFTWNSTYLLLSSSITRVKMCYNQNHQCASLYGLTPLFFPCEYTQLK